MELDSFNFQLPQKLVAQLVAGVCLGCVLCGIHIVRNVWRSLYSTRRSWAGASLDKPELSTLSSPPPEMAADVVSWVFANKTYNRNRPVLIDAANAKVSVSAHQAHLYVRWLIAGLKAAGLQQGDGVCILSFNHIYYPVIFLAIIGAGGHVIHGSPGSTNEELIGLLKPARPKFIFSGHGLASKALALGASLDYTAPIYIYDNDIEPVPEGCTLWTALFRNGETDWVRLSKEDAVGTVAALYSTSGTSGLPKLASVSHSYLTHCGEYIESSALSKPYEISRLIALPMTHVFTAPFTHLSPLRSGTPTYILPRFSPSQFSSLLSTLQITEFPTVPAMLQIGLSSKEFTKGRLSSVRQILSAGAPLSVAVYKQVVDLMHEDGRLAPVYGMTEISWASSLPYPESSSSSEDASGVTSIGRPLPGFTFTLLSPITNQTITSPCQPGELLIRAPYPTLGYLHNPTATRDLFDDNIAAGWIRTGDIASRSSSGEYYIIDRAKDLIKVKGLQVSPSEIENVLLLHPLVAEAAVVGMPDQHGISGEVPHAFVVLTDPPGNGGSEGIEEFAQELKEWVRGRLAKEKWLSEVHFLRQIPRGASGKVLRRILRDLTESRADM